MHTVSRFAAPRAAHLLLLAFFALITAHPAFAQDTTPPTISNISVSPNPIPVTGGDETVTCHVVDSGTNATGVSNVALLVLRNGNSYFGNGAYAFYNNGNGNYIITLGSTFGTLPANTYSATPVTWTFQIIAHDNAGNQAIVNTNVTQPAPPAPKLSNAAVTPNIIANGGATVTLKVNAKPGAPRTINFVRAEVYEDGTDMGYSDLNYTSGTGYSFTRNLPAGNSTPHLYSFVFTAYDSANVSSSVTRYAQQAGTNTLPAPTLTKISPSTGFVNTGVTLTGTNFTPSSVVLFDGFVVPATYVSAASLTCAVDKSFLPSVKQAQVQVYNPAPAGGTSAGKTFTINPNLSSLALSPTSVAAGGTSTGTVTLSATSSNAQTVMLTSSNAAATVPASVVVPAGQKTATFTVTTGTAASSTSVTITAKLGATKTATLTVTPVTTALSGCHSARQVW